MQTHKHLKVLKAATLITALSCTGAANAQWTTTGTNTTTTNNVGIGTTTPDAKLSIISGYSTPGCSTYAGQPALKVEWQVPDLACPFPGPTGTIPNMIEIFNKSTLMGPPVISPYLWLDYAGRMGLGTYPTANNRLTLSGNSVLKGTVQVGNQALPSGCKLVVDGDIAMVTASASAWRNIKGYTLTGGLTLSSNTGSADGSSIEMYGQSSPGREGSIHICSYGNTGTGIEFINYDPAASTWRSNMKILNTGKVVIGNTQPSGAFAGFKLGVDGDIVCKRAVVQITDWADYVFHPDYRLPSLQQVESFIKQNNHLPDVPGEQAIREKGVDVGDMNRILLQKVEELTLYIIQQQKEIDMLKQKVQN